MALEFEFISPEDKPALLGLSTPEYMAISKSVLSELGYKVHAAGNHEDFSTRFAQIQYHAVILEESFASSTPAENTSLQDLQTMPMSLRRHATIILLGHDFQTLNPMQAFQQSVHAVIHPNELGSISQIIQKVVADNNLFLHIYRDTQTRIAQGNV